MFILQIEALSYLLPPPLVLKKAMVSHLYELQSQLLPGYKVMSAKDKSNEHEETLIFF